MMGNSRFWSLCILIIKTELAFMRAKVHRILTLAIKNMMINKCKLEEYICQELVGQLVEELASRDPEIQIKVCEMMMLLLNY